MNLLLPKHLQIHACFLGTFCSFCSCRGSLFNTARVLRRSEVCSYTYSCPLHEGGRIVGEEQGGCGEFEIDWTEQHSHLHQQQCNQKFKTGTGTSDRRSK